MLQSIHDTQDVHTVRYNLSSVSSLSASRSDRKVHLLLAATGSVATIKLPNICQALSRHHEQLSIRIILTSSACKFLAGQAPEQPTVSSLAHIPGVDGVYLDKDEWGPEPWRRGKGVLHIELRKWSDLLLIAPLSANTLAKITNGMADNLATSVVRAWDTDGSVDGRRRRIVVAPSMNTAMWRHPVTTRQIGLLEGEWGVSDVERRDGEAEDGGVAGGWFEVLRPTEKTLACGDVGEGAMREWTEIVQIVERRLGLD